MYKEEVLKKVTKIIDKYDGPLNEKNENELIGIVFHLASKANITSDPSDVLEAAVFTYMASLMEEDSNV